jgi:hypothetical protein
MNCRLVIINNTAVSLGLVYFIGLTAYGPLWIGLCVVSQLYTNYASYRSKESVEEVRLL